MSPDTSAIVANMLWNNRNSGSTLNCETTQLAQHTTGYYVSGRLAGLEIPATTRKAAAIREISQWLENLPDSVEYVGVWKDGETIYFDVTDYVSDNETAYQLSQKYNQLAYYDIASNTSVYVEKAVPCESTVPAYVYGKPLIGDSVAGTAYAIKNDTATIIAKSLASAKVFKTLEGYIKDELPLILHELEQFEKVPKEERIARAIITGIFSAQMKLDKNLLATNYLYNNKELLFYIYDTYGEKAAIDAGCNILRGNGENGNSALPRDGGQKVKYVLNNREFIMCEKQFPTTYAEYAKLRTEGKLAGIGPKIFSFINHLINPQAPVFTLDIHMLRLCLAIVGIDWHCKPTVANDSDYFMIATAFRNFAETAYPDIPVFAVQWAIWDAISAGQFRSHLALIGR